VELFSVRLTPLVIVIGLMVMAVWVGNLVAGLIAHASLASTMAVLYRRVLGGDLRALERLPRVGQVPWRWRPTAPRMISLAVITLLAAGLVGVGLVQTLDFDDRVEITAHRGGGSEVPENTLAAIEQGIAAGADWIEVDVQESSDGVVMVVHDSDLKRLAGKPVKIWEATAEELRRINLAGDRDAPLAARRMPTLREVLELCRGKAGVNIELKYYGHERALEAGVAEVVEATGMTEQVVAMSLKMDAVRKLKRLRPGWRVGLLTAVTVSDLTRSEADFLAVKSSLASRSFVQQAHRSGKAVAAWTLNDPYSISLMASRGVDQLITDRPGLARQVIQEREEMMPLERLGLEIAHALGVKPAPR
jgi:glycerophosphoryl diester phosphodiesterase